MRQTDIFLENSYGGSSNGYDGIPSYPYVGTNYYGRYSYHNLVSEWEDSYWEARFRLRYGGSIYKIARTAQEEIDRSLWPGLNWSDWSGSTDYCWGSEFEVIDDSVHFSIVYEVRYTYNEPRGEDAYGWINVYESGSRRWVTGSGTAHGGGGGFQPKHYCTVINYNFGPGSYYITYGGGKPKWSGLSGDAAIRITNKEYIPDTNYVECGWSFQYI